AIDAGRDSEAAFERPAKAIGAGEPDRSGNAFDGDVGNRQAAASFVEPQDMHKFSRSGPEGVFEASQEMTGRKAGLLGQRLHRQILVEMGADLSATRRVRSRAPSHTGPGALNWRTKVLSSWTRWAISPWACSPNCFACFRNRKSNA